MYIALRLLRDGAAHDDHHALPQRRRPALHRDGGQRGLARTGCGSSASTCATRGQVVALADEVAAQGPLDILINNAAQTVRRSPEAYAHLAAADRLPLPSGPRPEILDARSQRRREADAQRPLVADAAGADRARADRRLGLARADRRPARRSTPAASRPTCTRTTAGARSSTRSTRSSCSRSSSATRPRRSS